MEPPTLQDVKDYVKALAKEKGCPLTDINIITVHWEFVLNREACMEKIRQFRQAREDKYRTKRNVTEGLVKVLLNNQKTAKTRRPKALLRAITFSRSIQTI